MAIKGTYHDSNANATKEKVNTTRCIVYCSDLQTNLKVSFIRFRESVKMQKCIQNLSKYESAQNKTIKTEGCA